MKWLAILVLALAGGVLLGCYSHAAKSADRLKDKVEAFGIQNGRMPTDAELAVLQKEADEEEKAIRAAELAEAKEKAIAAGGAALSGNLIGAGILGLGAVLAFFGLGRKEEPKPKASPPAASSTPIAAAAEGGGAQG